MISRIELERKLKLFGYSEDSSQKIIPKLEEINELKKEKNAIILAHYYQIPPIQIIADIKGDSLALAIAARDLGKEKRMIISSTVYFMAEMVKLLSPDKKVIIPDLEAGCSIARGMDGFTVKKIKTHFPNSGVIAYINTNADVKAEVDSICTSANAKEVIEKIEGNPVILLPDYYFAKNILNNITKNGKKYFAYKGIEKGNIVLEDNLGRLELISLEDKNHSISERGNCIVHENFTPDEVLLSKEEGVDLVLAHPEVKPEVAKYADMVGGTNKMISYLKNKPDAKKILFITECDMAAPLREAYPDKDFITPCRLCPYMKKNSLDKIIASLKYESYEVTVNYNIEAKARHSLEKMFELTGGKNEFRN